jgi:hypothetical protein
MNATMTMRRLLHSRSRFFGSLVLLSLLCWLLASLVSVRSIFCIDPVSVFRG